MNIARKDWHWQYNEVTNTLEVCSDVDSCYSTGLRKAQLCGDAMRKQSLAIEDLSFLHSTYEILTEQCGLDDTIAMNHAMSAVSARKFFKPVLPQSWFFLPSSANLTLTELMVVELDTPEQTGLFITVASDESTSLIMLISEKLCLTEHKNMVQGSMLRVMNDRIARYASMNALAMNRDLLRA
ncbi:cell division protein ZapC domain-containing protein [Echinimonas agarilytica]|uniref:Cell division protein ZapC n=1 Tax=Echinimonas agarilytica TaxID=1215918 RepID=A0AA41WAF9_9GAMM|nr:cell division protein ZapC domain-containing protein [Echinimonas agarilytica]MCM2681163.1 cell division protein ZapC [Echinimonas agarilytica]